MAETLLTASLNFTTGWTKRLTSVAPASPAGSVTVATGGTLSTKLGVME